MTRRRCWFRVQSHKLGHAGSIPVSAKGNNKNLYRDRIKRKKYDGAYRLKTNRFRQNFYQLVGLSCFFCGSIKQLSCHRKDFQKHVNIASLTLRQIELENPEDYARVCYCCHYGVHWAHNILGLTWPKILIQFKINDLRAINEI